MLGAVNLLPNRIKAVLATASNSIVIFSQLKMMLYKYAINYSGIYSSTNLWEILRNSSFLATKAAITSGSK